MKIHPRYENMKVKASQMLPSQFYKRISQILMSTLSYSGRTKWCLNVGFAVMVGLLILILSLNDWYTSFCLFCFYRRRWLTKPLDRLYLPTSLIHFVVCISSLPLPNRNWIVKRWVPFNNSQSNSGWVQLPSYIYTLKSRERTMWGTFDAIAIWCNARLRILMVYIILNQIFFF